MPSRVTLRGRQPQIAAPVIKRHFTAWSFSRLKDYRTCPRYAAWKHLAKMPVPDSEATSRGSEIHKGAEDFINGKAKRVMAELARVVPVLAEVKALGKRRVQVEANWGFDQRWQPVAWDDWANCWLRVKMDVHWLDPKAPALEMIDWKSGKPKPDEHKEQLKLYGVAGLRRFQDVERAHGVLHYTDHGTKAELTVKRREEKALIKFWEGAVKPMFNDRRYAPKPGPFCRYCPFSKEKGGACQY